MTVLRPTPHGSSRLSRQGPGSCVPGPVSPGTEVFTGLRGELGSQASVCVWPSPVTREERLTGRLSHCDLLMLFVCGRPESFEVRLMGWFSDSAPRFLAIDRGAWTCPSPLCRPPSSRFPPRTRWDPPGAGGSFTQRSPIYVSQDRAHSDRGAGSVVNKTFSARKEDRRNPRSLRNEPRTHDFDAPCVRGHPGGPHSVCSLSRGGEGDISCLAAGA